MNQPAKTVLVITIASALTVGPAINYPLFSSAEMSVSAAAIAANSSVTTATFNTITDEQIEIVSPVRDQKTQS
ncbi:hypothetical protein [Bradyrhizobium sp. BR 10261]|uniref:hypothetical protein n=1 Tax=Bradyrhizobium sp. BR 10261 TaxID=2749992 RepID=UPI001C64A128|nr:hypothetical protein [Bradyrhizobium sp. BR 10261]MBW7967235.1 hypothetical protein [Bradyrhizobium sp. BR 10261]